jgi:hypothetical protein
MGAAPADLRAIIDAGQGDRSLKDVKFRCAKCGSRRTDAVMMGGPYRMAANPFDVDSPAVPRDRAEGAREK